MSTTELAELIDSKFRELREGSIVTGTIQEIRPQVVLVDIGYKSEGAISISEFEDEEIEVGDQIEVLLERLENDEGIVVLSKEKAAHKQNWDKIVGVYRDGGLVKGKVKSVVKGGLMVNVGVEAFLPGSQVDIIPPRDLNEYVGKVYEFKIVKVNDDRKNIVLSRREVIEAERADQRQRFLETVKEGDKVVGVYASDEDGNIVRINAKKGVVLSCGDMSSDTEMLTYYAPQATKYGCFFSTMDKSGKPVNTGDGHKMAMWAGAVMEDGPYAPMTHSLGTNSVGIDPFLMVNQDGKRFANEDVGAQELQNAIKRQKGGVSYQIFDSKWKEQLSAMPQCFDGVTHYIPPEQEAEYEHAINHFAAGYASDTYFQGEIEQGSIIPADSIEELAKAVNIPADALVETVERYNELAHAGKDADFSKVSTRLFPVENPPYCAVPFGDSGMLVLIGGIDCDVDCRALDAEKNPVPGLFVAGNTMGGRFLVDYPVTVAGASHSMAMSFGRLAGRKAAEGK